MNRRLSPAWMGCAAAVLVAACAAAPMGAGQPMGFFVTSANPGRGGDLGGLAGADRHCQSLAAQAGAGGRTWRAYLSANAAAGQPAVDARDRIGRGPWYNAKGELIAGSVAELHADNRISKQTALTEKGEAVSGRGDPVNRHDILTGSSAEGRAVNDGKDNTCGNWTRGAEGSAIVGHHDRVGPTAEAWAVSWNASHPTQGCSLEGFQKTGGAGLLYCFAVN